jgi:hypothetical protein
MKCSSSFIIYHRFYVTASSPPSSGNEQLTKGNLALYINLKTFVLTEVRQYLNAEFV